MVSEKSKIYGVDNVGQSTPTLTRTDSAIGLTVAVETSEIKSDFDRCYPWSDMYEVVDELGNVFIKIPKFYSRITKNANGTYKHQLSGYRYEGFTTLFVDGQGNELDYVLVGKYEAGQSDDGKAVSKSGETVLVNVTLPEMREACAANGEGYQQYDLLIDAIIKELFLIEMATTNCQSVMYGYANSNSAAIQTGRTDGVKTASGSEEDNADGHHACKYRGIENPWGNVFKWCDGINFHDNKIYICLDPTKYESDKSTSPYMCVADYSYIDGMVSAVECFDRFPLLSYPTDDSGDENTYYGDYAYIESDGDYVLFVGGYWSDVLYAGLWYWNGCYDSSNYNSDIGGRLCFKPL